MAFGSHEGLIIWDGIKYKKIVPKYTSEKINPYVNDLIQSNDGNIWVATRNSVWRVSPVDLSIRIFCDSLINIGGVQQLQLDEKNKVIYALHTTTVLEIPFSQPELGKAILKLNKVAFRFIYLGNNHFSFYTHKTLLYEIRNKKTQFIYLDTPFIQAHIEPITHQWLILKENCVEILNPVTLIKKTIPLPKTENFNEPSGSIFPDYRGGYCVSISSGVFMFKNLEDTKPTRISNDPKNSFSILYNSPQTALVEKDETIWLGGSGGGISISQGSGNFVRFIPSGAYEASAFWMFSKIKDELFIGTSKGLFITQPNGDQLKVLEKIHPSNSNERYSVTGVWTDDYIHYLIFTYNKGVWEYNRKTHELRASSLNKKFTAGFQGYIKLLDGRLLLQGTNATYIFNPRTKEVLNCKGGNTPNPLAAMQDSKGRIWIGSGYGITILNSNFEPINDLKHRFGDSTSIASNIILTIKETNNKDIYVGTMGNGLCRWNESNHTFSKIKLIADPNIIYGIIDTDKNHLLLSTSAGLIYYNTEKETQVIFNTNNYLPFNDFNQLAFYKDGNKIYAGGELGMLIIDLNKIPEPGSVQNNINILSEQIVNEQIILQPAQRSIKLPLGLLNPTWLGLPSIAYRLLGFEKEWNKPEEKTTEINYQNLLPGDYIIELKTFDSNGLFTEQNVRIPVKVLPYFYETIWFSVLLLLSLVMLVFLLGRYITQIKIRKEIKRLEAAQQLAKERFRISRELHDNVGSQLTYFISGIETSGIYLENKKENEAKEQLYELKESARESLQQLRDAIWALSREEMTLGQLEEQFRKWYGRITEPHLQLKAAFTATIDKQIILDPVTALNVFRVIQEAVNNAIKHADANILTVRMECENSLFIIEITDNGKGISNTNSEGLGMKSMRSRIEECKGVFSITSAQEKGTSIKIELEKK